MPLCGPPSGLRHFAGFLPPSYRDFLATDQKRRSVHIMEKTCITKVSFFWILPICEGSCANSCANFFSCARKGWLGGGHLGRDLAWLGEAGLGWAGLESQGLAGEREIPISPEVRAWAGQLSRLFCESSLSQPSGECF